MPDYKPETGTFGEYDPNATPTEAEIATAISHPVLTHLNGRLADALAQVERTNALVAEKDARILQLRDKWRTAEYSLEAKLKELLDDESIELEYAKEIAEIFDGITLSKQITIQYDITATATIEVPYGADPDDVASSTYVERVEFYTDFEDAEVLESDHDVNDWRDVS